MSILPNQPLKMTPLQIFVDGLSERTRYEIVLDWKSYSAHGMIGDSTLRSSAEELNASVYGGMASIIFVMRDLYATVCEYYAYKHFSLSF